MQQDVTQVLVEVETMHQGAIGTTGEIKHQHVIQTPGVTMEHDVTQGPGVTMQQDVKQTPGVTMQHDVTQVPDVTMQHDVTQIPGVTMPHDVTQEQVETKHQDTTESLVETKEQDITETLGVTRQHDITQTPADRHDIYAIIEQMARNPRKSDKLFEQFQLSLDKVDDMRTFINCADKRHGETILHTAVKCLQFKQKNEKHVVEKLIEKFPKLILQDRVDYAEYTGQTPLHMAVCKGHIWLVRTLLNRLSNKETKHWKEKVLKLQASGTIFNNTVMLGQLPLSIAALTFNKEMFDLLLNEGAELDGTNSNDDNVCHSLVRYGRLHPEKTDDVIEMCRKLAEDPSPHDTSKKAYRKRKLRKKIWLMYNKNGQNPLQLSVKVGFHEMFSFIMELDVYRLTNSSDGLFDIKIYDVTELDAISVMNNSSTSSDNNELNNAGNTKQRESAKTKPFDRSVLMILLDLDPAVAFPFIQFLPVRLVINRKWKAYRKYFYPLWLLHTIFMFFLTWYAVERARQRPNSQTGHDATMAPEYVSEIPKALFVTAFGIISVIFGILYICQELLRIAKGRMPWTIRSLLNPYSHGVFRIMFLVLGVSLILDFFLAMSLSWYENYSLIISVITGWFLCIFFIRALKPFSFFTVLIQNVILGDMFPFFVIIAIELTAFATTMYMAIQGSSQADDPNYSSIWRVLFSMFTLMVGLGDMADIYQTRNPILCVAILIAFVVMTTLLMINGLIAMMSRTCMELVENVGNMRAQDRHSKLQCLSVILFLESMFMQTQINKVGKEETIKRYDHASKGWREVKRYMLELRSLQSEGDDAEDEEEPGGTSWGFRTVINAVRNQRRDIKDRPSSAISDRLKNFFRRKNNNSKRSDGQSYGDPVGSPLPMNSVHPVVNGKSFGEIDIYRINRCDTCQNQIVSPD